MEKIKDFFNSMFGAAGGIIMFAVMLSFPIGFLYWMWMAIQIGSFWMFVLGVVPPIFFVSAVIGAYSLIFGIPAWIFSTFG